MPLHLHDEPIIFHSEPLVLHAQRVSSFAISLHFILKTGQPWCIFTLSQLADLELLFRQCLGQLVFEPLDVRLIVTIHFLHLAFEASVDKGYFLGVPLNYVLFFALEINNLLLLVRQLLTKLLIFSLNFFKLCFTRVVICGLNVLGISQLLTEAAQLRLLILKLDRFVLENLLEAVEFDLDGLGVADAAI